MTIHPDISAEHQKIKEIQNSLLNNPVKVKDKVLIVTDVHGHLPALEKALEFSEDAGVNFLISLGDMTDYNPFVNEVMAKILQHKNLVSAIRGNHEEYIKQDSENNFISSFEMTPLDGKLAKQAMELPSNAVIELSSGLKILLCHANIWNEEHIYIFPDDQDLIDSQLEAVVANGFFFGHTHLPTFYQNEKKFLCNPGSLGVPRSEADIVTFAWLDPVANSIKIYKMNVDSADRLIITSEPELFQRYEIKVNA